MQKRTRSISLALATLGAMFAIFAVIGCGQDPDAVSKEIPAGKANMEGKKNIDYLTPE